MVSIVMSVFNGEEFLRNAINSVLNQSYTDWELIAVDDGSSDNSLFILKKYADVDNRIHIIHKDNSGLTESLNVGLKMAKGDYIARIDCDDLWHQDKLLRQVEFMRNHLEIGICGCAFEEIDGEDRVIGKQRQKLFVTPAEIKKSLVVQNPFFHSSVLFRSSLLEKVGNYDPAYRYAQDYDLWARMLMVTEASNLPEVLAYRRYTKGMISIKKEKEQRTYATRIKRNIIKTYDLPLTSYRYLINDIMVVMLPKFITELIRHKI